MYSNKDMQVKLILLDSYIFFLRNFRQIASLCLPLLLVDAFFESLLTGSQKFQLLSWASSIALYPIYTAALIFFMAESAKKEHPRNMNIIASSLKIWWPFFILTVIHLSFGLVGLFIFILPGIWIIVRLSFAEFFLILNDLTPWEAISQSFIATKQYFWFILSFLILSVFCNWIFGYFLEQTIKSVSNSSVLYIAADSLVSFIMLFFDVVLFRVFMVAVVGKSAALQASGADQSSR